METQERVRLEKLLKELQGTLSLKSGSEWKEQLGRIAAIKTTLANEAERAVAEVQDGQS